MLSKLDGAQLGLKEADVLHLLFAIQSNAHRIINPTTHEVTAMPIVSSTQPHTR
jgi:hypothetical protein